MSGAIDIRHRRLLERLVRTVPWDPTAGDPRPMIHREWIVTNGLGGYASASVCGLNTRRYHGVLVAALPNPLGRMVMLERVSERVVLGERRTVRLDVEDGPEGVRADGVRHLAQFRLDAGLPVWCYEIEGRVIEKRVLMIHAQNTVHVRYSLLAGDALRLHLRPAVNFRSYEGAVGSALHSEYRLTDEGDHWMLAADDRMPPLRMKVHAEQATFEANGERVHGNLFCVEQARGYECEGAFWTPGAFSVLLAPQRPATLVATAEPWDVVASVIAPDEAASIELERRRRLLTLAPVATRSDAAAELVLAADQFLITPAGRYADATRARAVSDEVRTVIAGYHWFTDWGRDTMIALEGLTLVTGRHREAGFILRTFARYVRDGLIPNMFPDGSNEGLYHTADATMWFFHAVARYVRHTSDHDTLALMLPVLRSIVDRHVRGTRFGIGIDERDGLLREGAEGFQLTWMDAKVGDWVVTPRRGKPVEINALWYNALRLLEGWLRDFGFHDESRDISRRADRVRSSFNERFWYADGGYLYDVIDGPDGDSTEFRPNQLFAFSLDYPVLEPSRWASVLEKVESRLLTPVGLRSLAPGSRGYRSNYAGDLRARDAAYHQGTVWAWLIGPWIDAWLRVHPGDRAPAHRFLEGVLASMSEFGVGTIAEIFDAEAPYAARGCVSQAWSVAETLRCLALCADRTAETHFEHCRTAAPAND